MQMIEIKGKKFTYLECDLKDLHEGEVLKLCLR